MGLFFEVGLRPYVFEFGGNDKAAQDDRVTIWYQPLTRAEKREIRDQQMAAALSFSKEEIGKVDGEDMAEALTNAARYIRSAEEVKESVDSLEDDILARIKLLTKGKPGGAGSIHTRDATDIYDTITQAEGLAAEVVQAVVNGTVSEVDAVFFGWLTTGEPQPGD